MIKAILFDLDDTLYDTTSQVNLARRDAVDAIAKACPEIRKRRIQHALEEVISAKGPNYPLHFNDVLRRLCASEPEKAVAAGIIAYHKAKIGHLKPIKGLKETLKRLRRRGYRLGVVTDGVPVKQWEKLLRLGVDRLFDAVIVTSKQQEMKPHVKPFLRAVKALGVKPSECVMVGDRLDRDILGAHKAGMKAIQVVAGRHMKMKPKRVMEEPDYIIADISQITEVSTIWSR